MLQDMFYWTQQLEQLMTSISQEGVSVEEMQKKRQSMYEAQVKCYDAACDSFALLIPTG